MAVILLAVAVGLVVWLSRRGSAAVAEPAEVGAVGWAVGTRWAVTAPLARVETGRLLRHPAFIVGIALTPLMLAGATGSETLWWRIVPSVALALVPLGWATIIASNLLALQPRRTGADELLAAAPAPQPVRSLALMLSAAAAAFVAGVIGVAWLVYLARGAETFGSLRPAELLAGMLIVAGSVTVGVGVARWLPSAAMGLVAAFATALIQARFFELSAWPWYRSEADPLRFLAFLADTTSVGTPALEVRPAGWHVAYLAGLVLFMACVALARDGVPRRLAAVFGAIFVLIAVTGWAQLRPPTDGQVTRMVTYLTAPESHQTCTTDGQVRYCASAANLGRVEEWRRRTEAVRALLPAAAADRPLLISDRVPTVTGNSNCSPQPFFKGLHPHLAGKVTAADVWPDDGAVHPGTDHFPCGGRPTSELFTAVQVGSWAVGLPPSPHHLDVRCAASGQARAAVALWLGAVVTPGGEATLRALINERTVTPGHMTFFDWDDPPMWGITFARSDAETAHRLLALPPTSVAGALARDWDAVIAPGTTTADLARLTGLTPPPAGPDPPATGRVCP